MAMAGSDLRFYSNNRLLGCFGSPHQPRPCAVTGILLMSMTFEPTEPEIATIVHEVERAAARGVMYPCNRCA
jgi:hypothetical protein